MSKHTPGPWRVSGVDDDRVSTDVQTVAHMEWDAASGNLKFLQSDEVRANARLIAEAPAMLEALGRIASANPEEEPGRTQWDAAFQWAQVIARAILDRVGEGE